MAKKKEVKFGYYDEATVKTGVVPETDRTPAVKYTYHPLSIENSAIFDSQLVAEESPQGITDVMLRIVAESVVSWNLRKPDRKNPNNTEGLPVDPKDIEELKKVDEFIIDSVVTEIKRKPVIPQKKAKN